MRFWFQFKLGIEMVIDYKHSRGINRKAITTSVGRKGIFSGLSGSEVGFLLLTLGQPIV